MIKLFKYCWQHPWIRVAARRALWTLFTLVTAYFLLCAVINWYGARRLKDALALLAEEGETVDVQTLLPQPLNDAENYCAIEPLRDLAMGRNKEGPHRERIERLLALQLPNSEDGKPRPPLPNPSRGQRTDLAAFNEWTRRHGWTLAPENNGNPAADLLKALGKQDALFEELSRGLERTKANWTPEWTTRELPKFQFYRDSGAEIVVAVFNSVLALRAVAAAQASDGVRAHQSALIMSRFALASSHDPFGTSASWCLGLTQSLCGIVWVLCDAQVGSAEDFSAMEKVLSEIDPQRIMLAVGRTETTELLNAVQMIRSGEGVLGRMYLSCDYFEDSIKLWKVLLMRAIPAGFFDTKVAIAAELQLKHFIQPLRDESLRAALQKTVQLDASLKTKGSGWSRTNNTKQLHNAVWIKAIVDQARIGCALERHRIETGGYPESLDALKMLDGSAPPMDVMSGKPMLYRRIPGGKYAVWSVGFDCKDNNGKRGVARDKSKPVYHGREGYQGDWVWDFPRQ